VSNASYSRLISDAIVAKLETGLSLVPVGDGVAPSSVGTPPLYAVVDHMDGTVRSDMDEADTRVKHVVQVRSVGATRNAAQYVQDLARDVLLARDVAVAGISLLQVVLEVGGRVYRDDDADPSTLFLAIDRIAFYFDTRG